MKKAIIFVVFLVAVGSSTALFADWRVAMYDLMASLDREMSAGLGRGGSTDQSVRREEMWECLNSGATRGATWATPDRVQSLFGRMSIALRNHSADFTVGSTSAFLDFQ